jgi:endonuclease YncB( thermonuclease family)
MESKIRRKPVAVRASRIRRDPVRVEPVRVMTMSELRRAEAKARDREMWSGVGGVALFGAGIAIASVALGVITFSNSDPTAAAKAARFEQCYAAEGGNCVADGDTIQIAGEKVQIAGIEAPQIDGAKCEAERTRGIAATVRLPDLLNGGNVTVSRSVRDQAGRTVRHVLVNGEDVGQRMLSEGLARPVGSSEPDWCAPSTDEQQS